MYSPKLKIIDKEELDQIIKSLIDGETIVSVSARVHIGFVVIRRNIVDRFGDQFYKDIMSSHLTHRYKKNNIPWNKDLLGFGSLWLKKYSYRIGHKTTGKTRKRSIGTITIRRRKMEKNFGYGRRRIFKIRFIKIAENKWIAFARYLWLTYMGPIPLGKCVVHLDQDHLNDDFDNLSLLTHGQYFNYLDSRFPEYKKRRLKNLSLALKAKTKKKEIILRRFFECVSCGYEEAVKFSKCPKCNCIRCEEIIVKEKMAG